MIEQAQERNTLREEQLLEIVAPVFDGTIYRFPVSELNPSQRLQRRLAFRNERYLHQVHSALSGKRTLSTFSENSGYKVIDQFEWWSDAWDAMSYGREFDFSKTFTEQYQSLLKDVPHCSLYTTNVENSYYTNYAVNLKDCYLVFGATNSESCQYGKIVFSCTDCLDCLSTFNSELCYETVASEHCYDCSFIAYCRDCSNLLFCEDCASCKNCILCIGQDRKQYCIGNVFVGRERYEQICASLFPLNRTKIDKLKRRLESLKEDFDVDRPRVYASEACTGDMIQNSKNSQFCFDISNCEDCLYVSGTPKGYQSLDTTYSSPGGVEFCYNVCSSQGATNSVATFLCWECDRTYYSIECHKSQNLLGCVGLKKKSNCIFNVEYSEAEYQKLASRIAKHMQETGEWGEFFAKELSFFSYGETVAQEYFPLEKRVALEQSWVWRDEVDNACSSSSDVLRCANTSAPFKINERERIFYRNKQLPEPILCPNERHRLRFEKKTNIRAIMRA